MHASLQHLDGCLLSNIVFLVCSSTAIQCLNCWCRRHLAQPARVLQPLPQAAVLLLRPRELVRQVDDRLRCEPARLQLHAGCQRPPPAAAVLVLLLTPLVLVTVIAAFRSVDPPQEAIELAPKLLSAVAEQWYAMQQKSSHLMRMRAYSDTPVRLKKSETRPSSPSLLPAGHRCMLLSPALHSQ